MQKGIILSIMTDMTDFYPFRIKVAFFDLDETLICRDSDTEWARWRARRSFWGWKDLWGMRKINRLYYSHKLSDREYGRYHLSRAASMNTRRYPLLASRFADTAGRALIYPEMLRILKDGREHNIRNVIITAQDEVIGSAFASVLDISVCIASRYTTRNNRYTGMEFPLVFQEGKVLRAGDYLKKENLSFEECAFFSDSLNDLPLLEKCGFPVAVHPGEELEALAVEKSWPILRPSLSE